MGRYVLTQDERHLILTRGPPVVRGRRLEDVLNSTTFHVDHWLEDVPLVNLIVAKRAAITFSPGNVVLVSKFMRDTESKGPFDTSRWGHETRCAVLLHELVHSAQMQDKGLFEWYVQYFLEFMINFPNWKKVNLEEQARDIEWMFREEVGLEWPPKNML